MVGGGGGEFATNLVNLAIPIGYVLAQQAIAQTRAQPQPQPQPRGRYTRGSRKQKGGSGCMAGGGGSEFSANLVDLTNKISSALAM